VGKTDSGVGLPNAGEKGKSMTLRKQTRLIFGVALIGLIGVLYTASSTILLNSLKQSEEQETRHLIKGVVGAFAHSEDEFNHRFIDWSTWDDTYRFIQDVNQRYIESNLPPEQLALLRLNLVLYVNSSGRIVYGTGFDLKTTKKLPVPEALRKQISAKSLLVHHPNLKSNVSGIVLLPEGAMMISSRPILTSQGKGPIRGTLIFGRYLNTKEFQELADISRSPLTMHGLNETQIPADFQAARSTMSVKQPISVRRLNEQMIAGYALMPDIYGKPALILRMDIPRETYQQGQISLRYLFISLLVVGLVFSIIILLLLERLIISQHERQEKEERYRAVVAQASEGIFLVDADSKRFLEANAAFQNLLGFSSKELLGLTLYDVIADTRENVERDVEYIHTKKQSFAGEWRYYRKDNSLIDLEVSANSISYQERDALCIVVRDITDRKQAENALRESERRLSWQATHDPLTELINRREFERRLEQAVLSTQNSHEQHALCYLDLDRFKIVNNTCGHVAGDALLRQVSSLFKTGLRKADTLARLGGDEFGLLLYQCPLEQALQIANMLRERIYEFRFQWEDKMFTIGVSIGLVAIDADTENLAKVLSKADAACYAAKKQGRNQVHIYQADDEELTQQRSEMQWVSQIKKALAENNFRLYYQKIVPIAEIENQLEHCEVLLRLEDESGTIVSPSAFMPIAERYNFLHLIDRWVISTLFTYLGKQYQNWDGLQVQNSFGMYAVKLSVASINDDKFINFVQEQFAISRIPPSIICFEITENVAITNLAKATRLIGEFKALGCLFALDNFGSGMSSFAYLKNLSVDYLKVDGIFIKDIVRDPIALLMVEAISHIASMMKIQTIAKFVEDNAILSKLKSLGINYAQGYGIAQPCAFEMGLGMPLRDQHSGEVSQRKIHHGDSA
jgi:diguanylate cyclase (GGDEF)-like protein/PAS domain S-box-containing protein